MSNTPRKLLWIDDDGEDRFPHECQRLRAAGYEIFWARSGQEAEEQLRDQSYEVILLDQQFPWLMNEVSPVWGGVLLYAWATGKGRPAKAPPLPGFDELFKERLKTPIQGQVLIVSAFHDDAVAEARRELGLSDSMILAKPIDLDALFESIQIDPL